MSTSFNLVKNCWIWHYASNTTQIVIIIHDKCWCLFVLSNCTWFEGKEFFFSYYTYTSVDVNRNIYWISMKPVRTTNNSVTIVFTHFNIIFYKNCSSNHFAENFSNRSFEKQKWWYYRQFKCLHSNLLLRLRYNVKVKVYSGAHREGS